jgi:zinc D-Ala-D-Ala carboxypeptidase
MLHFELSEFDSPDEIGSGKLMDAAFLQMLDDARGIAGIPFRITSGYRTPSHNAYVGGVQPSLKSKGSSHLFGYAADIACNNSADREVILNSLIRAGFRRIGIANGFIHVDNDPDKNAAVWLY